MPDQPTTQNPDETTAQYLHRLVHEKKLGSDALADALLGADLSSADLVIAAANSAKRREEDFTVDLDVELIRNRIRGEEEHVDRALEEMSDEEVCAFVQGILDSEGFQELLFNEVDYWFRNYTEEESQPQE